MPYDSAGNYTTDAAFPLPPDVEDTGTTRTGFFSAFALIALSMRPHTHDWDYEALASAAFALGALMTELDAEAA